MSRFPPNLLIASGNNLSTSATANTQATVSVLAVAPAQARYRVWGYGIGARSPNTAPMSAWLQSSTTILLGFIGGGVAVGGSVFPPGGVMWPATEAILVGHIAGAASQKYDYVVYYTVEATA